MKKDLYSKPIPQDQIDRYQSDLERHENQYRAIEPPDKTSKEWRDWNMNYSLNRPNEPGYYRANND